MFFLVIFSLFFSTNGAARIGYNGRIVGGTNASIEDYPYQVSLHAYNFPTCGGSIISPRYIITAAHCTYGEHPNAFTVRVGSNTTNENGQEIAVQEIYENPLFDINTMDYDISILNLYTSIKFGPRARPIGLASKDFTLIPGTKVIVTGWGTLQESGEIPVNLQVVEIPYISNEECQEAYKNEVTISERMMCAKEELGGKDSCQGDSGGPLVADGLLVGIVSWGYGCARENYPGVYSRISQLREFIYNVTQM